MDLVDDWAPMLAKFASLKESWPTAIWAWDERMCVLASSFATELGPQALASASLALPTVWDTTSIKAAPKNLQDICARTGSLRPGQKLLSGKEGRLLMYGLWWPWGTGATITLRIGLCQHPAGQSPFPELRSLFNAPRSASSI